MAITVTVTATKIDVTSTGGVFVDFDDVVIAVNAVTAGTITGTGTSVDPYVITATNYRELEISSGCKVTFVADTYVTWGNTATSGAYIIDWVLGSEVEIEEGCVFDMTAGGTTATQIYNTFYGTVNVTGTALKPVVFKGMTRNHMYFNTGDVVWTYFNIDSLRTGVTGYAMWFNQIANKAPNMTFNNFTITNSAGAYGLYFSAGGMYANVSLYGFTISGCSYGVQAVGCSMKIGHPTIPSYIEDSVNAAIFFQGIGNVVSPAYETSKDDTLFHNGRFQSMGVVENVTFTDNDAGVYSITAYYNSLCQIKDCTFVGDTYSGTQDGILCNYGSVTIEYNNTYTNIHIPRFWDASSTFLHGRKFDILVRDLNGDPIKDATVSWIQGSTPSKERWTATTNSDGKVLNVFGCSPMFIEKEETSAGNYQQWSNNTSTGMCHRLCVTKYGYHVEQATYEMTEDKDVIITLTPIGDEKYTSIKNATLYGTIIY